VTPQDSDCRFYALEFHSGVPSDRAVNEMEIDAANKVAEGHPVSGQAVVIAGEAGVGKTFLSSAKKFMCWPYRPKRSFQLIIGQAHLAQKHIPARVLMEVR
jgi:hypothetical protein